MRSLIRDRSVVGSKVPKGTVRRILRCLAPFKGKLTLFFGLTIVDSSIGVAVPLIYRAIIDTGIGHRDTRLIVVLALVIGGLAVLDAGLSLGEQLCTAQVGQGLIYDLRTQVYAHVQKMSLAFFTRTQTGALVSRLNNDVLGAQQADDGHPVLGRWQSAERPHGPHDDADPVLADHPCRARPPAGVCDPGRASWVGASGRSRGRATYSPRT